MSYVSHNAGASPDELRTIFELVKIFPDAPPAQLLAQLRAAGGNKNVAIEFFLAAQAAQPQQQQPVVVYPAPLPPSSPSFSQAQPVPQNVASFSHINNLQANLEAVYEKSIALLAEQLKELKTGLDQRDQEITKLKQELKERDDTIQLLHTELQASVRPPSAQDLLTGATDEISGAFEKAYQSAHAHGEKADVIIKSWLAAFKQSLATALLADDASEKKVEVAQFKQPSFPFVSPVSPPSCPSNRNEFMPSVPVQPYPFTFQQAAPYHPQSVAPSPPIVYRQN